MRLFHVGPFYLRRSRPCWPLVDNPFLLAALLRTLSETVIGYFCGVLVGILSGALFFQLRLLRELFFPLFVISQTIPVIAFGAIIILMFGNTLAAKRSSPSISPSSGDGKHAGRAVLRQSR